MNPLTHDILALASQYQPHRILTVGQRAQHTFQAFSDQFPECTHIHSNVNALMQLSSCTDQRYDFCCVSENLSDLDHTVSGPLIAKLRDILCRRLAIIVTEPSSSPNPQALNYIGYGLERYQTYQELGEHVHLYTFDIRNYKKTPDWLNSKNWANPQLWDKYRW